MVKKSHDKNNNSAAQGKNQPKRSFTSRILWFFLRLTGRLVILGAICLAIIIGWYAMTLPKAETLMTGAEGGAVTLLDRNGNAFAWRGGGYGGIVKSSVISPNLRNAIVAAEDKRFYRHFGIDPRGIARAMWQNLRARRFVQGGSTITQQVVKNTYLDHSRSLTRKLKEVPIAIAMELMYSKEEILSIYINRVYLGAGTHGFEAASHRYFNKSSRDVTIAQSAMLAGLLKAPSRYAPTSNLASAQGRASVVLSIMQAEGYISEAEALRARANPAQVSGGSARKTGQYFADWVFEGAPDWLLKSKSDVLIKTTFDPKAQLAAEIGLKTIFDAKVKKGSSAQAAIVVLSPDGAVRAMVGGRSYKNTQFNRATQAMRQPGSAFKPIVYATAFEAGLTPLSFMDDYPITIDDWQPKNYDDQYRGPITLADALTYSVNTVAVRTSEQSGRENVRTMAQRLGLTTEIAEGPSVALGVSETSLIEMSGIYTTIANRGVDARPYSVIDVKTRDGEKLLSRGRPDQVQLISAEHAGWLTSMMSEVVSRGTGKRARLSDRPVAGKTGTTQGARDAWFIGFSADYVTGVWMGKDDNGELVGVGGGGLPADIWRETMARLHNGLASRPLPFVSYPYSPSNNDIVYGNTNGDGTFNDLGRRVDEIIRKTQTPQGRTETIIDTLFTIFGGTNDDNTPGTARRQRQKIATPDWPESPDRR